MVEQARGGDDTGSPETGVAESGHTESGHTEGARTLASLESALERLRLLVIQTTDTLADSVLGQIQTARGIVEQTDALVEEVRRVTPDSQPATASESHLRAVSSQIEEAIRDLPESSWDAYAQICVQLARMVEPREQID